MSTTEPVWPFEADCEPDTRYPRVRFNFDNGWSASLIMAIAPLRNAGVLASVACAPAGHWNEGKAELGPTEASADEAMAWIDEIRRRAPIAPEQDQAA